MQRIVINHNATGQEQSAKLTAFIQQALENSGLFTQITSTGEYGDLTVQLKEQSTEQQAELGVVDFLGEVALINGETLAKEIGLEAGNAQFSDEPWLHFELDGKTLYVAKKPLRHSISWNDIHEVGAALGKATITIGENTYRVRLLKGSTDDICPHVMGFNPEHCLNSEWNRLMYTVHNGNHIDSDNLTLAGRWPQYNDDDLHLHYSNGKGTYNWMQEHAVNKPDLRVHRGGTGLSHFYLGTSYFALSNFGWRPCLELIS